MTAIRGSVALVTGASGGIGRAVATALAAEGARVVVTGRRAAALEELAAACGGRAVVADLADPAGPDRLLEEAGPVDIAVMNAAVPASGRLESWDSDEVRRALEINLAGPMLMTRALLSAMDGRSGHLVYVGSLSAKVATASAPVYTATKFGLRGFAHAVRCDLRGTRIGCSVVNPGFVSDAGMFAETGARLPPGVGTVTPERVARAVVRAVRYNRAEIDVAPLGLRLGSLLGSLAPGVSAAVQGRVGASVAEQIVEGQRHKRS
jgi:NADP-dependent 3-hydroxy acid dehydrogenase YdfG